jgi:peroxiredoxin
MRRRSTPRRWQVASLLVAGWLLAVPVFALEAGDIAPGFRAPRLDGAGELSLSGLAGKVVLLDFWASWCAPCQTSMPQLEALRKEFAAERFELVGVNVDRDAGAARKLIDKHGIGYPNASDPGGGLPARFGLETMPTAYLIDGEGVIRYVHRGFRDGDIDEVRTRIRALLAEPN